MARPLDWLRHESDSHIGQRDGLDQLLNPDPAPPAPDFTRFGEDPAWLADNPGLGAPPLMDFDAPLSMSGVAHMPGGGQGTETSHGHGEVAFAEPASADAAPFDFGAYAQGVAFATAPLGPAIGHGADAGGGAEIFAIDGGGAPDALSAHFHEGFTTGYLRASDQSDQALNADTARAAWHLDGSTVAGSGTPIKIGILSDSFNLLGGAASDIANGDLPSSFNVASNVLEEGPAGGNDEGRAMAELIHRIAPGAQLYFHTAFNGQADFAAGIEQLQAQGCQIIVDDVTYFDEPFFQDNTSLSSIQGAVHDVVALGSSYFTAASNEGKAFYGSAFNAEAVSLPSIGSVVANNFGGGNPFQNVTIPRGEVVDFVLQWDQPFASIGTGHSSQNSLAFLLYDSTGTRLLLNENVNATGGDPVQINEFVNNTNQTSFKVAIIDNGGAAAGQFKYIAYTDDNGVSISGGGTGSGSLIGHEMNIDANTVGAAYWGDTPRFGTNPAQAESFSSMGPGEYLFDANGNHLSSPDLTYKVDFVAPDGSSTSVFNPFFGTSAAAPDAAAVAALMLNADGALDTRDITNILEDTALSMAGGPQTGAGLIQADQAVSYAARLTLDLANTTQAGIIGTHLNDTFIASDASHAINGGGGTNTIDYSRVPGSITVNLVVGNETNHVHGDTLSNIQNVIAGGSGNLLIGGYGDGSLVEIGNNSSLWAGSGDWQLSTHGSGNTLHAGGGTDYLRSGGGANTLIGGGGTTIVDYSFSSIPIVVNMPVGHETNHIWQDNLVNINNVLAGGSGNLLIGGFGGGTFTEFGDSSSLYAGSGDWRLVAAGNSNNLVGGGGNDTFIASGSGNTMTGNGGNNTFILRDGFGSATITDFTASTGNKLDLSGVSAFHAFSDVQSNWATQGSNVVITDPVHGSTLTLQNVTTAYLQAHSSEIIA